MAPFRLPNSDDVIASALAEDLGVTPAVVLAASAGILERDVTGSLLPRSARFNGVVRSRAAGIVCGLPIAQRTFEILARAADVEPPECFPLVAEGAAVPPGTDVLEVEGDAAVIMAAERTAMNLLMVLSGIATEASRWQVEAGPSLSVVDTRKTLPGLRALSKYAVRVGGAANHRMGLHDMVLVKDNHIAAAGGITAAVERARRMHAGLVVEVEADTVAAATEAASAGADMVLLDNMDDETLRAAVAAVRATAAGHRCLTEASGGVTIDRLPALAALGLDRVSSSALTFAPPLDFGLDERGGGL